MSEFNHIISKFENDIKTIYKFDILEKEHNENAFGSGYATYKIKEKIFRIVYDGRDFKFDIQKLDNKNIWKSIFYGDADDFLEKATLIFSREI